MRGYSILSLACCLGLLPSAPATAADAKSVVEVTQPGEHSAVLGQTVQFVLRYDGFSGKVITGLAVEIDSKTVKKPRVEARPDPKLVDVGQAVFVFTPERAGTYKVKIIPLTGQTRGEPREYALRVAEK